ncbi:MAG TPA: outer membrane beta-barrel protein, partial [Candidatus Kapabacteria bacterium]|nr:outer membrane beta-barrel protein [Candidatus Kapabacteria bacterium]
MSYKKLFILSAFTFLSLQNIQAQTPQNKTTYGFYGGLNINFHSPNFTDPNRIISNNLYNVDSSTFSTNATSIGFAIGGIVNYSINDRFQLSGRLGYNGLGTKITSSSRRFTASDTVPINSEIDASLGMIEVAPLLRVKNVFAPAPLNLLGGFEFSIPFMTSYTHVDRTISGTPSPLLDGQSSQDRISNPIASLDAAMRAAFVIGADYEIPLNKTTSLVPEITFRMPFTTVSSNTAFDSWSVPQLRVGISLTFGNDNKMKDDNIPSNLDIQMDNIGYYTPDGLFTPLNFLKVEDIAYSELYPVVPYIFFEANSNKPFTKEYQSENTTARAGAFTLNNLQPDAISINRSLIDIIGYRMNANKQA